jgi:hypothetical protein
MTEERDPRPYLVITVLLDSSARPAEISRSHGDAYERSLNATQGQEIAGLELVELPIAAPVFKALRQPLAKPSGSTMSFPWQATSNRNTERSPDSS